MKIFKQFLFFLFLNLLFSSMVYSQITITSDNILSLSGKTYNMEQDTSQNSVINVGSAGANQTWDFSSVVIENPIGAVHQFVQVDETPFANEFPTSNLVEKVTFQQMPGFELYSYYSVTGSLFSSVGFANYYSSQPQFTTVSKSDDSAPLPLQFGTTWNSTSSDTTGSVETFGTISTDTDVNTVDAWGTVILEAGSFPSLRIRTDSKSVITTYVSGIVINTDTVSSISYNWISNNTFYVATVSSMDGETDPNFTNASSFSRLTESIVGVEDKIASVPDKYSLSQNYPNPFNPTTLISFNLPEASEVTLKIYDITGREVKTLINKNMNAGNHSMEWNGKNNNGELLSSGVYLYRINTGNFVETKKAVLLK